MTRLDNKKPDTCVTVDKPLIEMVSPINSLIHMPLCALRSAGIII